MGLKCRIVRNADGTLTVYDNNGQESVLYKSLFDYFNRTGGQAVVDNSQLRGQEEEIYSRSTFRGDHMIAPNDQISNLTESQWTLVRTPAFIERYGDWINGTTELQLDQNGEPLFTNMNGNLEGLSEKKVRIALAEQSYQEGAESKALLLWALANDQVFKNETGVVGEPGLDMLLDYYRNFGNGVSLTSESLNSLQDIAGSTEVSTAQAVYSRSTRDLDPISKQYNRTNLKPNFIPEDRSRTLRRIIASTGVDPVLGYEVQMSTTDLLSTLDSVYLGNVETLEDITDLAEQLPEAITGNILANSTLRQELFTMYRNLTPVEHYTLENGELIPVVDSKLRDTTRNTIIQNRNTNRLLANLNVLSSITSDVMAGESEIVQRLLKSVERDSIEINIDTVGLASMAVTKPYTDFINYINSLRNLVELINNEVALPEDIDSFMNDHLAFYGIQEDIRISGIRNTQGAPIAILEGSVDAAEAFQTQGLIRMYDNVWMKVDPEGTLDTLVNERRDEIPAYLYNKADLGSESLRQNILNFFNRRSPYGQVFESGDSNALYNMAYYMYANQYTQSPTSLADTVSQVDEAESQRDPDYLMYSFVPEFYNFILNQKANGSTLYNRLLKHFYVNDAGLQIEGNPQHLLMAIQNFENQIPMIENLYRYAEISGNQSLLNVLSIEPAGTISMTDLISVSIVDNSVVPTYQGVVQHLQGTSIRTEQYAGDIIKYNNQLYKISDLSTNTYTQQMNPVANMTVSTPNTQTVAEMYHRRALNSAELTTINDRIDNCGY